MATSPVTGISSRVLWASDFPSAVFRLHACQDRGEQERALWYRNLHLVHKPVGSSSHKDSAIDLETFHKQVKFS